MVLFVSRVYTDGLNAGIAITTCSDEVSSISADELIIATGSVYCVITTFIFNRLVTIGQPSDYVITKSSVVVVVLCCLDVATIDSVVEVLPEFLAIGIVHDILVIW